MSATLDTVPPPAPQGPPAADATAADAAAADPGGPLTGHAYDGIAEYDNPMPGWWKWLFVATVVFSAGYYLVAVLSDGGLGAVKAYEAESAELLKQQLAHPLSDDAASLLAIGKDDGQRAAGAAVFAANCAVCHKPDGSGLVGPNLTDDVYLNVRAVEDIPKFVRSGSKNLAMPAFGGRLAANDVVLVAAYVASLRGQNKPGKPPEGQPIPPWTAPAK